MRESPSSKVERLRAAIEADTYVVDIDLLALRILEDGVSGGAW